MTDLNVREVYGYFFELSLYTLLPRLYLHLIIANLSVILSCPYYFVW